MAIKQIVGYKPDWYGEIEIVWSPTEEAMKEGGVPENLAYCNLLDGLKAYPLTDGSMWELRRVEDIDNCIVVWHSDAPLEPTGI